ncbi:hypothetical protein ACWA7J_02380 [Leptothrix sp. BB-4]
MEDTAFVSELAIVFVSLILGGLAGYIAFSSITCSIVGHSVTDLSACLVRTAQRFWGLGPLPGACCGFIVALCPVKESR